MTVADVIVPENAEGTKATILRWCRKAGDNVLKDEPLLEIETDKVTVEIPSPVSGELLEILKVPDDEVVPGQIIARVRFVDEDHPVDPAPAAMASKIEELSTPIAEIRRSLSPAVRQLLATHGLSAEAITGHGGHGRITAQDVLQHIESQTSPAASTHIAHTPIRRRVAEHMVRSLATSPHVTTVFEADLSRVLAHRARHAADFERQGARLTVTAYLIASSARALMAHPQLNATFHEDSLELHSDANIGIGTSLGDQGLIVPVLHRAQTLDLVGIAAKLAVVVAAARAGTLAPADVRGGTFTISNHGVGGSLLASPIVISQPQVAILGVGKIARRVCVVSMNGAEAIAVRSMCYITLTIDHRAVDAFQANNFLSSLVAALEQWPEN